VSALHITNGDCAAQRLREFLSDPVITVADVLHDGPARAVDDERWYEQRARFLADAPAEAASIRDGLAACDRLVDRAADHQEVVLWFEHDLFDQLNLIRTLDRLARVEGARVRLICIDRFPGVDRFIGLGQLDARQLSTLTGTKAPVTADQYALASQAWAAFRASNPLALFQLASARPAALPFLADALFRLLAEYPSTRNGLSATAQRALETLAAGPIDAGALFQRTQAAEERPFLGDWSFFDLLRRMATARVPLLSIEPEPAGRDLRGHLVSQTDAGRRVVNAHADAVHLNGIDEWRGGVHLQGSTSSPWRWDFARNALEREASAER
jgi:hypothetical protein